MSAEVKKMEVKGKHQFNLLHRKVSVLVESKKEREREKRTE